MIAPVRSSVGSDRSRPSNRVTVSLSKQLDMVTPLDGIQVTCGSVVKLKHVATGFDLHSHEISYGSGSGQQSVTGFKDTSDANSLWFVTGAQVSSSAVSAPLFHCINSKGT